MNCFTTGCVDDCASAVVPSNSSRPWSIMPTRSVMVSSRSRSLDTMITVAPDSPGKSDGWWSSLDRLKRYDLLILSCEGRENVDQKSPAARQALYDYVNLGGRVFASHWHNSWLTAGPEPFQRVASFFPYVEGSEYAQIDATIDTTTPKGSALADWMLINGGSPSRGVLPIRQARNSVRSINAQLTQQFVYYDFLERGDREVQYFTFNTPIGAAAQQQCGRMVFTDMHISGNDANHPSPTLDLSAPDKPFPSGCVTNYLSAQEKALLFLLFDLTNCVQPVIG